MSMTHTVELPDHVYQIAQQAAEKEGVTPEQWIAATVSRVGAPVLAENIASERPLNEALAGFIGVIDSRTEPRCEPRRSAIGDLIAEKYRKKLSRRWASNETTMRE